MQPTADASADSSDRFPLSTFCLRHDAIEDAHGTTDEKPGIGNHGLMVTAAFLRDREVEAARAHARAVRRFAAERNNLPAWGE